MKKGFTLIELLAVIVILAIIALIATPIVLNIINDTKESAMLRSADFYIDALENEIMLENMKQGGSFNPNVCTITNSILKCDGVEINLKADGEMPTNGTITFEEGKVLSIKLNYKDGKTIVKNNEGKLVFEEPPVFEKGKFSSVCKPAEGTEYNLTPGTGYKCKVKEVMEEKYSDGYTFYVLSYNDENGNITSDKTKAKLINLIMDRNINSDGTPAIKSIKQVNAENGIYNLVAYNIDGDAADVGPVTVMNFLNNATSTWENIQNLDITYNDEGGHFNNFKITGKARLPYLSEVSEYDWDEGTNGYLYNNLHADCYDNDEDYNPVACKDAGYILNGVVEEGMEQIFDIYGYWTLSSNAGIISSSAWFVDYVGSVSNDDLDTDSYYGARPVINLKI